MPAAVGVARFVSRAVVIQGAMFNSFWAQARTLPEKVGVSGGKWASPLIAFHRKREEILPLYLEASPENPQKYSVEITGGNVTKQVQGYSVPNIIELLSDPALIRNCDDEGQNYHGLRFILNQEKAEFEMCYCLAQPPDGRASLWLTVKIREDS